MTLQSDDVTVKTIYPGYYSCLEGIADYAYAKFFEYYGDLTFRREENIVLEGRFRNQKRSCLISGVTDFAYSNDYILLTNFKLQNLLTT